MTPLKNAWLALYKPVTENLRLDMRMNLKTRKVRAGAPSCSLRSLFHRTESVLTAHSGVLHTLLHGPGSARRADSGLASRWR